jgi:hypothetical protein
VPTKPKLKVAKSQADEPPLVFAMPENPPSTLSDRVAVRLEGITYLLAPRRGRQLPSSSRPRRSVARRAR